MAHTFGQMSRDKEKRIREQSIARRERDEKKTKDYDDKMKDPAFRLEQELGLLKNHITAAEYDYKHTMKGNELIRQKLSQLKQDYNIKMMELANITKNAKE